MKLLFHPFKPEEPGAARGNESSPAEAFFGLFESSVAIVAPGAFLAGIFVTLIYQMSFSCLTCVPPHGQPTL